MTNEQMKDQLKAAFRLTQAMAEAIQELKEVPAGILYAHTMGEISLEQFEKMIGLLVNAKLVEREQSHMLRWVGPAIERAPLEIKQTTTQLATLCREEVV